MDATTRLAAYALELDAHGVPDAVVTSARRVFADTVGVMFAASTSPAVRRAVEAFPLRGGPCTVIGHGRDATPETAAFINAIGGHDIELDDAHPAGAGHGAAAIVPAAIAAAEIAVDPTYGDLLAGIIVAYDVQGRVLQAMGHLALHERGFHPSAVCGPIGAAVAAGRILGLTLDELRSAIALAASQSSGLLTYRDDPTHMAKSFQLGVASRNGVVAALLARRGFRGAPNVLTGRHDSVRPFVGAPADPATLVLDLGRSFVITGTSLKRHACCSQTHAAIDALLSLMTDHGMAAERVRSIEIELASSVVPRVDGHRLWTHNIQYLAALAAFERRIGPEHFSDEWTKNAAISRLAARVTLTGSNELDGRFPKGAIVRVTTDAGSSSRQLAEPIGGPAQPLTDDELAGKFRGLVGNVVDPRDGEAAWKTLMTTALTERAEGVLPVLGMPSREVVEAVWPSDGGG